MPLKLNAADGTSIQLSAPSSSANNNLNLPIGNGVNGQFLQTDGSGNLSWGTAVQVFNTATFNNSGTGAVSGTGFSGVSPVTISYNTIGAANTTGTNVSGTWPISITGGTATLSSGTTSTPSLNFTGNTTTGIYSPASNVLAISTGSTERVRIDNSGNLSLGVISPWTGISPVIQSGYGAYFLGNVSGKAVHIGLNQYYNGSNFVYTTNDYATRYDQNLGQHIWLTAASGSTNGVIAFSQPMTLTPAGNLLLGTATSTGTTSQPLQVIGGAYVSGNVGVGTTNPSQKLHVVGNSYITGAMYDSNNSAGTVRQFLTSNGTGNSWFTIPTLTFGNYLTGTSYNGTAAVSIGIAATSVNTANNIIVRDSAGSFNATAAAFSGQISSTLANSTTTGGGQIYLNGANGNRIDFSTAGVAAPAFTTRSAGTKIVLYPNVGASSVDFALGIDNATFWQSVDASSSSFKWYAGTTNIATLSGAGALTAGSFVRSGGTSSQFLKADGSVDSSTYATASSTTYVGTTAIALNRASANQGLTGISSIAMPGATSGTITLTPAATAGTTAITIPATAGTLVTTGDSGTVTSTMIAAGTIVDGDISASAAIAVSKLAASTISGVTLGNGLNTLTFGNYLTGTGTTYNGFAAVTIGAAATSLNTANNIVVRDASGNFSAGAITGTSVLDSSGNLRNIPINSQSVGYTLAASDNGKCVTLNSGSTGVTIPANIFSPGNTVAIYNNSGGVLTATQGAGCTVVFAGNNLTGNRTIPISGFCSLIFIATNTAILMGAGVT